MPCLCVADGQPAVEIYCCEALPAWQASRWDDSWKASERSLAIDPDYSPSILLHGFSLIRLKETRDGVALLKTVQADPEVGRVARRAIRTNDNRWNRDQLSVSSGFEIGMGGGFVTRADIALSRSFGARLDFATVNYWPVDYYGLNYGLMGTWNWLYRSWRVQVATGATSTDLTFPQSGHVYGARASVSADVRAVQAFGVGFELGGSMFFNGNVPVLPFFRSFLTFHLPQLKRMDTVYDLDDPTLDGTPSAE